MSKNDFRKVILTESQLSELMGFHGAEVEFSKFNHKKYLGSGCGSHVYGWGTYITDDKVLGQSYADAAINRIIKLNKKNPDNPRTEKSFLYTVDIPDNDGTNYINWHGEVPKEFIIRIFQGFAHFSDKNLEFLLKRQKRIGGWTRTHNIIPPFYKCFLTRNEEAINDAISKYAIKVWHPQTGEELYKDLSKLFNSQKSASLFLNYCGFDGTVYKAGQRIAPPEGASPNAKNYVIYQASKIHITGIEKCDDVLVKKRVNEAGETPFGEYMLGRVSARAANKGDYEKMKNIRKYRNKKMQDASEELADELHQAFADGENDQIYYEGNKKAFAPDTKIGKYKPHPKFKFRNKNK